MQFTYFFDDELRCFIVTATGPANVSDLREMMNSVSKDKKWQRGVNVIVDYRSVDLNTLTSSDIDVLVKYVLTLKEKSDVNRLAHVVSKTVDYGMIRMWENMILDQVPFFFRVFYSMDEARGWIASPEP